MTPQEVLMPLVTPTLDRLVSAAQANEVGAMEALFQRFQPLVRRLLGRYRHLPVAEDLPGETYLDPVAEFSGLSVKPV
jgi:DNA-directed RNA polymerase specialized sigma24 family protein